MQLSGRSQVAHIRGRSRFTECSFIWFYGKMWRESNPELAKTSNVRDYATIHELTVLSNLETHNAHMIREGKSKEERFTVLKEIASYQMSVLTAAEQIMGIEEKQEE